MKKVLFLLFLFIIYSFSVNHYTVITNFDVSIISLIQEKLKDFPIFFATIADCSLYSFLIILPLILGFIFFFKKYLLIDIILFSSSPLIAYILNIVVKNIIQRPRPPIEMQIVVQPSTYSFVSSHTLVTATLWGLVIYYLNKYCQNKNLKIIGIVFSVIWILSVGFSRIWLGVHNPSDVLGAYFLASILLYIYIKLIKLIGGKG